MVHRINQYSTTNPRINNLHLSQIIANFDQTSVRKMAVKKEKYDALDLIVNSLVYDPTLNDIASMNNSVLSKRWFNQSGQDQFGSNSNINSFASSVRDASRQNSSGFGFQANSTLQYGSNSSSGFSSPSRSPGNGSGNSSPCSNYSNRRWNKTANWPGTPPTAHNRTRLTEDQKDVQQMYVNNFDVKLFDS